MGPSRYFGIIRGAIEVLFLLKCLVIDLFLFVNEIKFLANLQQKRGMGHFSGDSPFN